MSGSAAGEPLLSREDLRLLLRRARAAPRLEHERRAVASDRRPPDRPAERRSRGAPPRRVPPRGDRRLCSRGCGCGRRCRARRDLPRRRRRRSRSAALGRLLPLCVAPDVRTGEPGVRRTGVEHHRPGAQPGLPARHRPRSRPPRRDARPPCRRCARTTGCCATPSPPCGRSPPPGAGRSSPGDRRCARATGARAWRRCASASPPPANCPPAPTPGGELFDAPLADALRRFQARHGLDADAIAGRRTLAELNTPAIAARAPDRGQSRTAALAPPGPRPAPPAGERRRLPARADRAGGAAARDARHRRAAGAAHAIFHRRDHEHPFQPDLDRPGEARDRRQAAADPRRPLLPRGSRVQGLRALAGAEWREIDPADVDWTRLSKTNFPYRLRQEPGPDNALGRIKFQIPNRHDIYLHDTPSRGLFARAERAFSSGCIRVERAVDLAERLLAADPAWTRARIEETIAAGSTVDVRLPEPLPVYLLSWTAWVDRDGALQLREDIYGRDDALLEALARPLRRAGRNKSGGGIAPGPIFRTMLREFNARTAAAATRAVSRARADAVPRPRRVGGDGDLLLPGLAVGVGVPLPRDPQALLLQSPHGRVRRDLLLGERRLRPDGARADRRRSARPPHRGDPADVPGADRPGLRSHGAAGNKRPRAGHLRLPFARDECPAARRRPRRRRRAQPAPDRRGRGPPFRGPLPAPGPRRGSLAERGGVGYYPTSGFVHVDVAAWRDDDGDLPKI